MFLSVIIFTYTEISENASRFTQKARGTWKMLGDPLKREETDLSSGFPSICPHHALGSFKVSFPGCSQHLSITVVPPESFTQEERGQWLQAGKNTDELTNVSEAEPF